LVVTCNSTPIFPPPGASTINVVVIGRTLDDANLSRSAPGRLNPEHVHYPGKADEKGYGKAPWSFYNSVDA